MTDVHMQPAGAEPDSSSRPTLLPYFTFTGLDHDPVLLRDSYRLRYSVYCDELQFLDCPRHGRPEERDEYDAQSIHVGAVDRTGSVIGTARLVRPRPLGLPMEEHCTFDPSLWRPRGARRAQDVLHQEGMAEISRLVVAAEYRRRRDDGRYALSATTSAATRATAEERREQRPVIALGIYKACYQESKRHGITHWLMAVESRLVSALARYQIVFSPIGPEVSYYGPVAPHMARISEIEERMALAEPDLFAEWLDGLEPELRPT